MIYHVYLAIFYFPKNKDNGKISAQCSVTVNKIILKSDSHQTHIFIHLTILTDTVLITNGTQLQKENLYLTTSLSASQTKFNVVHHKIHIHYE